MPMADGGGDDPVRRAAVICLGWVDWAWAVADQRIYRACPFISWM